MTETSTPGLLLEREPELSALSELIHRAQDGNGGLLLLEGPAGIGKTALLQEACRLGETAGMTVMRARGGELEGDFGYGIVRQLFEPMIRHTSPAERDGLFAGAARLAARVVDVSAEAGASVTGAPADQLAVLHGLYWLTANIADGESLLVAVDDLHWSDAPSLRYLIHLARRLDGMSVVLVLTTRPGEPGAALGLIAQLGALPDVQVLHPSALSESAVGRLLERLLPGDADRDLVVACRGATGGVPFLVHELLRALVAGGHGATTEAIVRVRELGPRTVAHATVLQLSRLASPAGRAAEAVAVLGRHAHLRRVARLVGVSLDEALAAVDALAGVNILTRARPPEFVHPIVRAAVYDALAPGARSAAHALAAELLAEEATDPEEQASHLLVTEPSSSPQLIATMRNAASGALSRGAPESAIAYLRRALKEAMPAPTRAALLHELGCAEAVVRDPGAVPHLQDALRLTQHPHHRAQIAHDLAEILVFAGHWETSIEVIQAGLADLGDGDPDLQGQLEALRAAMEVYDPRFVGEFDRRREHLHELAERGGPGVRALSLLLAVASALRTERLDEIVHLVERGLDGGQLMADIGAGAWPFGQPMGALVVVDELDRAEMLMAAMLADSRARGSVPGFIMTWTVRTCLAAARGALADVEADLRAGLELAGEHGMLMLFTVMLRWARDALQERPQLDDIAGIVETIQLDAPFSRTMTGAMLLDVRGRLRLSRGQAAAGIEDLRTCGEICEALHVDNPNGWATWRSPLAVALREDKPMEAAQLVEEDLALARATGLPRAQGVALRAAGLIEGGHRGIDLLRRSAAFLEHAPSPLERARTLVELGAALRRSNQRAAAREPLRAGLHLAHHCGADRLATRATEELRATGARPRRLMLTGRDALTPSEQRVAHMAAEGLSNRDIAQTLFVTAKTVENQLGSVYHKLGVSGRQQLGGALTSRHEAAKTPLRVAEPRPAAAPS